MMQLRILDADDLRQALPMPAAVSAMAEAYRQLSAGKVQAPLRSRLAQADAGGVSLVMPAAVGETGETAVKIVSVFPDNPELGLPTIHALVIVLSAETGAPLAVLDPAFDRTSLAGKTVFVDSAPELVGCVGVNSW